MNISIISAVIPAEDTCIRPSDHLLSVDIASLLTSWEASHAALARATTVHDTAAEMARSMGLIYDAAAAWASDADAAAARVLARIGPRERGGWRYEGREVDGLWGVVRTPLEFARPPVAEAVTAIDEETP